MQTSVTRASGSTVSSLFADRARTFPVRPAIEDNARSLTYGAVDDRTRRLANVLQGIGVRHGTCIAILSENRLEYLELFLAAGRLGAIVACQNWRLAGPELDHCLRLVDPKVLFVSPKHADRLNDLTWTGPPPIMLGDAYEALLAAAEPSEIDDAEPEDALLILYTSGTTGLPKGAVISHRAEIARNLVVRAEYGLAETDTYVAWSPMYHMGGAEYSLGALMSGGKVIVVDGFDADRLATIVANEALGWLLLMPGMVGRFVESLRVRKIKPKGVKVCGVMADLVPAADLAAVTTLLNAPYANTFGATETGNPPASAGLVAIGTAPAGLPKQQSTYCEIRLVDPVGDDVPPGTPGELWMRGPTLFSGYWQAPEANEDSFAKGWFHMGDVFVRHSDGTLSFVDRVKYLIKSGGENVYPAEIERVLLGDSRVSDAAVVRRADQQWGEVPVAFVAKSDDTVSANDLLALCRANLAGYKQPKDIIFIDFDAFPRSASGKIQRHELEKQLTAP
ncbi:MAG: acyl--CoA ligase [Alphaproteobacteria bacterium]|nr:acyl--CoA ligase [Alphaproteobacteria bacterium]